MTQSGRRQTYNLDMTETEKIPWKRLAVEATAIVASILLAFAIDAWWEESLEYKRSLSQLKTIETEFVDIGIELKNLEARLLGLREAVSSLLPHISPDSQLQTPDFLYSLIDLSFRASQMELPTGSLDALLASGELAALPNVKLKALLAALPAETARLRRQSGLLEGNREAIIDYLYDKVPTIEMAHKTGQMSHYPRSNFVIDPAVIQRDMKIEGLFGNRGMQIEDTLVIVLRLQTHIDDSLKLIGMELEH